MTGPEFVPAAGRIERRRAADGNSRRGIRICLRVEDTASEAGQYGQAITTSTFLHLNGLVV